MQVLAVGAHPDDVELFCAGTLAHYQRQGVRVTVAVLTNGELGSSGQPPAQTSAVRRAEAYQAANVLGAELLWLGSRDGFLYDTPETRTEVVDMIRRSRPDVIFAPHPGDYHPDHRAASNLVTAARLLAREESLTTRHPATARPASLFYMDTMRGEGAGTPDVWVDITETIHAKEAMLTEHRSQNDYRRLRKSADFVDLARRQASWRGQQVRVRYAEIFVCSTAYPVSTPDDLTCAEARVTLPLRLRSIGSSATDPCS